MRYLSALTSLRFFAALSIFVFHLQVTYGISKPFEPLANGVSFFFVLSGFILAYVYDRPGGFRFRDYLMHRVARIWPVHLATAALALVLLHPRMIFEPGWYPVLAANLLLVHSWVPTSGFVFSVNNVSWSISAEFAFYLAFPLILAARRTFFVLAGLAAFSGAVLLALDALSVPLANPDPWGFSAQQLIQQGPLVRLLEFAAGVAVGRSFAGGARIATSWQTATLLELISLTLVLFFVVTADTVRELIHAQGLPQVGLWYTQSGGFPLFALAIYVFAQQAGVLSRILSLSWLVRLGEASFGLYMVHHLVIMSAVRHDWAGQLGEKGALAAMVALSFGGAFLLWRLLEVPARRGLVALTASPRGATGASSS